VLEQPPKGIHIEIVRASKSDRWTPDIMARLKEAESKKPENVTYHLLENAGHWLHTDNPSGLIAIMAPILAKLSK
jgi:pimeloyl-ACP methyl ester carboxylesterase